MQWKDTACPTFRPTEICNRTINWLDYGNSFFLGYIRIAYGRLPASWKDNYWSVLRRTNIQIIYSMSSSRNSDESCHLGVWLFHDNAPAHKSLVAQQALCNCEFVEREGLNIVEKWRVARINGQKMWRETWNWTKKKDVCCPPARPTELMATCFASLLTRRRRRRR